jgi:hypothetical protein
MLSPLDSSLCSTISEGLASRAKTDSNAPAYLWLDEHENEAYVSYKELYEATLRIGASLSQGLEPDDVVGVVGVVDTVVHQTVVMGLMGQHIVVSEQTYVMEHKAIS